MHLQLTPMRIGELAKRLLVATASTPQYVLLHRRIMPCPQKSPLSVPLTAATVSEQV